MKAALNTISHLSDWQEFRSLTMLRVVRLGKQAHCWRGNSCREKLVCYFFGKKEKETKTRIYLPAYFCAKKYRKDKSESNEHCKCFSKSCKIKYKKRGETKMYKMLTTYRTFSWGLSLCKPLSMDSATIHTLSRTIRRKMAVPPCSAPPVHGYCSPSPRSQSRRAGEVPAATLVCSSPSDR